MSLLYDADGDKLDSTNNVSVPTAGTVVQWFQSSSDTARQSLFAYDGSGTGLGYCECSWRADLAGDYFIGERERASGATSVLIQADAANYAAFGLNKWLCLVMRWDTAGANADQSIWLGDELTTPAGPSAYTTQTVGSGTPDTTAGSITVGNSKLTTTRWVRGRVGFHALFPTRLSDADVNAVWRGLYQNSPTIWWRFGANGTTDVPDQAGSNTGIITGLSSPDQQPAVVFPPLVAWMVA
jgi:hypothetical protein